MKKQENNCKRSPWTKKKKKESINRRKKMEDKIKNMEKAKKKS